MHVRELIEKYYPEYYSWNSYPAERTAAFCKVKDEWGIFSNFAQTPLTVKGVTFYSAESLFQVMKFTDAEARKAIFVLKGQGLKMQAKHFEKTVGVRDDWGRIIVDVLKFCLMAKYEQSEEFRRELERSRGLFIVEDQTTFSKKTADTYGAKLSSDGTIYEGPNLMGRLLMELRDNGKLECRLPNGILDLDNLKHRG